MSEAATTLKIIDELKRGGFTDDQARSVVIAIGEYRDNQLATKEDFARLELKTAEIRVATKEDFAHLELKTAEIRVATKEDFAHLELKTAEIRTEQEKMKGSIATEQEEIKGKIASVNQHLTNWETSTTEKFSHLESAFKKDMQSMEYRLIIKLGVFFVIAISVTLAIARLL